MRKAIEDAPCSVRALARETGIVHTILAKIRTGEIGASPDVARRIAGALHRWERRCGKGADGIRAALRKAQRRR